ncbi:DNA cytosine methyltransferase [Enterococcus rotai]|uniref:DNA cytosine methyltransferase n=1 Tax=Enterococcus rotai TaxID=118060 RepID=UPI0035C6899D
MDVVDFFCGAGGFSEGFYQAGFNVVRAFDIWEPAITTHNKNHQSKEPIAVYGDIHRIAWLSDEDFEKEVPDSEIIIGSPPCVAFSNSNKSGKADKTLGITLLESYLRIVARKKIKKDSKLKYWILENVQNIESYIKDSYTMKDLGLKGDYVLNVKTETSRVYNVKYYGVPSNRKRYICGDFPEPEQVLKDSNLKTLRTVYSSLGDPYEKINKVIVDPSFSISMEGSMVTDHHYFKEIAEFEWKKAKRQKQDKGYMGRMAFPENEDKPARTIMATMSASSRESMIFKFGENENRYRYPTIREVATIMSFPIDYRFYGDSDSIKYRLVGNAVPPRFSYSLAIAIKKKENIELNSNTKKKVFLDCDSSFINLNGKTFPIKLEKEKKYNARYKYHIPYLIIDTYRVELQNSFNEEEVIWKAEIHKGQGKRAKVYSSIQYDLSFLNPKDLKKINKEIGILKSKILSYEIFQKSYCMTSSDRERNNLIGPDELLEKIKIIIDNDFNEYSSKYPIQNIDLELPQKIIIPFFKLYN